MKQTIFLLAITLLVVTNLSAQNKDLDAQYLYTQAENSYAKNEFEECIQYLEKAVETLGQTNPKILSLEFNAYEAILQKCPNNKLLLSNTKKILDDIDFFFKHIDIQTYPKEKYFEAKKFQDDYMNRYDNEEEKRKNIKRYTFEDLGIDVTKDGAGVKVTEIKDGLIKSQTDMKRKFWINKTIEEINEGLKLYQDIAMNNCEDSFVFEIYGNYGLTGGMNVHVKDATYKLKLPTIPK